ncbi:NAD(P)/FAD-dependent oxidoreductase [Niabella sp. W65]|nr:NAD(P)/FAD-dependent oxidoreductase [Niabella sp. W65]MCH7364440.1 NAD(P)/FAD-dependent oxidoreductase [Niabella sp. W65]ULT40304.1 NAD(P)/FAD-dependent oxidoreductase [Niabella sp. I65]
MKLFTMLSRRNFIKKSALLSAGIIVQNYSGAIASLAKKRVVICIGAGLAGLSAAYALKQKGYAVIVLESRDRIGGRVFSHQVSDQLTIELGGEWIGNSHSRIRELCGEFKLDLVNNQMNTHLIYKGAYTPAGSWDFSETWNKKWEQLIKGYAQLGEQDKQQLDRYDWWRYLVNNGCSGRDLEIRELLDSTDFGESIRQVSAFAALAEYAESSEKNEMDLKIKGGNQQLAIRLADAIGRENILLGCTVTSVEQTDKVTVTCANGRQFTADKLICTIPTFAISKINWTPGLPPEKLQAINALQYARINKHAMLFEQRFWKEDGFDMITDQLPHYFYHATKGQPGSAGVLISYSIGDKAAVIANQNDVVNARAIAETLRPLAKDAASLMRKQVNYYWGNDAISKGAYALYGPGQWFSLRPILSEPFRHTYFAGEHLADWQGFMEGAINTGEEAALQITG